MIDDFEKPEYFPGKLRLMEKARPQIFLLTGMSDFSGWRAEWRDEVFAKIERNPQHQYLFLTKRPEEIDFSTHLDNAWFWRDRYLLQGKEPDPGTAGAYPRRTLSRHL